MKNIIWSMLILFGAFKLNAQIQITSAHMPSLNDTVRYSGSNSTGINFRTTGANHSWDFKTLNCVSQEVLKFQSLLSTPYAGLAFTGMPAGSIGCKIADSIGAGQFSFKNV